MTIILGSYTTFEEQFLVAAYYTSNILDRDEVSFREVCQQFAIEPNRRWLDRALSHFVAMSWIDGPLLLGGADEQPISLTASGLREAEKLIEQNKFFTARVEGDPLAGIPVPASDRLVNIGHNQILRIDRPIEEFVSALHDDNGDPDQPGLRERLLGEVKAGRELIRAGTFRSYLLYETLVRALGEFIKRYKSPTLVALANALLGAIVSELFQAS
ncbi:hypothetical protein ACQHGV_09350 [Sphingomonas pseudosanguinis]|uniref:hypothetical protein n=1 Tax=Sphingomonas pseudosanguinis TaxID=413712 RepID=UPI003F8516EF